MMVEKAMTLFRVFPHSMEDDDNMGKIIEYLPEFRDDAVRLLSEVRDSYLSETKAINAVSSELGIRVCLP